MSGLVVPQVVYGLSNDELAELVAKVLKNIDWFANGNISSQNIRNIAGFNVNEYELRHRSGLVGLSGDDPTNPEAIRFWAGNADKNLATWLVRQKGVMEAIGAVIKSANGYPRIEFDGTTGVFTVYQSAENFLRLSPDAFGSTPGFTFQNGPDVVALTYLLNTVNVQSLFIGTPAGSADIDISSGKDLKLTGTTVRANGIWMFSNVINGSITGHAASADYADHAGTASAADELSPSGEIAWGQVLKNGSNIDDLETKNLSSLTQNSSYRTVSDAEKATWNQIANRTAISAHLSTTQAIASGAWVTVIFDTEENDTLNEFNSATSVFTAQRAGTYLISVMANWTSLTAGTRALVRAFANNSAEYWIDDKIAAGTGQTSIGGSMQINLNAGDTIAIQVLVGANATLAAQYTRASISRL